MTDPTSIVKQLIAVMDKPECDDGRLPVGLIGGPYDGCRFRQPSGTLLDMIRSGKPLFIPVDEDEQNVALYWFLPGQVAGLKAQFGGYGASVHDCGDEG